MHAAGYALSSFHSPPRAMTGNRVECCKCFTPMQPGYLLGKGHGNQHSITVGPGSAAEVILDEAQVTAGKTGNPQLPLPALRLS